MTVVAEHCGGRYGEFAVAMLRFGEIASWKERGTEGGEKCEH